MEKNKQILLHELYEELRLYKWKEFFHFVFASSLLLLSLFQTNLIFIIASLSLAFTSMYWVYRNLIRSLAIKKAIFHLQEDLTLNDSLQEIYPKRWKNKENISQHLGTSLYLGELLFLIFLIFIHLLSH